MGASPDKSNKVRTLTMIWLIVSQLIGVFLLIVPQVLLASMPPHSWSTFDFFIIFFLLLFPASCAWYLFTKKHYLWAAIVSIIPVWGSVLYMVFEFVRGFLIDNFGWYWLAPGL